MPVTTLKRRRGMSRAEFIRDHLNAKFPVILEGIMEHWPARRLWNADYLKMRGGNQMVEVMSNRDADPDFEINCNAHRSQMRFADYVDHVFHGRGNNTYMVANNGFMQTPAGRVLLTDAPPFTEYLLPETGRGIHMWFGPAGTVTPLHHDTCDILLCQVIGAKRVRIMEPEQREWLYNQRGVFSEVDYEAPDLARFPLFARAMAAEIILNAGEALFLPVNWWHIVRSLTPSISVSFTNFIR